MQNLLGAALAQHLESGVELERLPGRDLVVAAKYLIPTHAYLVQGCLAAAGIPAVVADANHAQADQLIAPAMGGVRILVPQAYLAQTAEVLAALERGDFTLSDDADVGPPVPI